MEGRNDFLRGESSGVAYGGARLAAEREKERRREGRVIALGATVSLAGAGRRACRGKDTYSRASASERARASQRVFASLMLTNEGYIIIGETAERIPVYRSQSKHAGTILRFRSSCRIRRERRNRRPLPPPVPLPPLPVDLSPRDNIREARISSIRPLPSTARKSKPKIELQSVRGIRKISILGSRFWSKIKSQYISRDVRRESFSRVLRGKTRSGPVRSCAFSFFSRSLIGSSSVSNIFTALATGLGSRRLRAFSSHELITAG